MTTPRPQFTLMTLLWLIAVVAVVCYWLCLACKPLASCWWMIELFWRPVYAGIPVALGAICTCIGAAKGKPMLGTVFGVLIALVASFAALCALIAWALLAGVGFV